MIDKLLGNSKDGKSIKDKFFQMLLTPAEGFENKRHWITRPYLRKLMAPEK